MIFGARKVIQKLIIPLSTQLKGLFLNSGNKPPWKILFFGTDKFSLFSLCSLVEEYRRGKIIGRLEVCTSMKKIKNDVHKFAEKENLRIWQWPPELEQNEFDTGLVVSFGHLIPKKLIDKFPIGMINVHASLLPRWRGAAPIIYSLANGDKVTGVSVMRIAPTKFDIGDILSQKSFEIPDNMYMPELYTELGLLGSTELVECLKDLPNKLSNAKPQSKNGISYAPKVSPSFASVDWKNMSSIQIFNLERALRGFLPLKTVWMGENIKLFNIKNIEGTCDSGFEAGYFIYDNDLKILKVVCSDKKYVSVGKVQPFQKKVMSAKDFNNGYLKEIPIERRYFL